MNKKLTAVVGIFLCATSVALGQFLKPTNQSAGRSHKAESRNQMLNIAPMTTRHLADSDQRVTLDNAAAVALNEYQYDIAEEDARQSLSHGIGAGISEELLAAALNAQEKTQEALRAYKVLADQGTVEPRNLLPYALLLLKTGHWAQAVAAYNKQLPYLAEGDLMMANSHFSPNMPQPRQLEIAIHIGLGLTEDWKGYNWKKRSREQTLTQFRQALALQPDSSLANYYYGYGLLRTGRRSESQSAFKRAADLGDDTVKAAAEKALR